MSQVQCPNCGGYWVTGKPLADKKAVAREFRSSIRGDPLFWLAVSALIAAFILFLTIVSNNFHENGTLFCWIVPLCILGMGLMFVVRSSHLQRAERVAATAFSCSCNLCGYLWTQRVGARQRKVTVRPELIALGEARLARQEEEERKRQQFALGVYTGVLVSQMIQQRKNK